VIVTAFREPAATWHVLALDAVSGRQVWNYESPLSLYGGVMLPDDAALPAAASHAVLVRALERGPNGLATTAVLTLDGRDGTLLWRYQPGGTINVPALAGSRVCLTSTIGTADGASTVVAMLDTATGRAIWSETMVGGASGCALSPDSVYLGQLRPGGAGGEFALDAASGNVRWNVALAPILTLGPPVVADGAVSTLIIRYSGATPNVAVAVLRVSDGHLLWRRDQGIVRTMAEPVLGFALDVTSGILVVTNGDFNAESAYSLRDGALLWQH
jgi:outer membrane protein assembly factor BamB